MGGEAQKEERKKDREDFPKETSKKEPERFGTRGHSFRATAKNIYG